VPGVRGILDPALKLMIDAVHRYDGYIVQSTGDGIFALFGAPVSHEDHPQRAVLAALKTQEDMRPCTANLRHSGKMPIEARVGLNTGEVVVRSVATGDNNPEYTSSGTQPAWLQQCRRWRQPDRFGTARSHP